MSLVQFIDSDFVLSPGKSCEEPLPLLSSAKCRASDVFAEISCAISPGRLKLNILLEDCSRIIRMNLESIWVGVCNVVV